MGCGESKHAVATENTVSKSKSKSLENNNLPVEKATNDEIVDARIQQKEENGNAKENKNPDSIKEGPEERKENLEGNDEKEGGKEKGVDDHGQGNDVYAKVEQEDQEGEERLISHASPCDFLFPKRDHEETTESIISKEISRKSEYHSEGHISKGKVEGNDAVEGKWLVGEAKPEAENKEALKVDEGKEVVLVDETKVSAATDPAADKENAKLVSLNDVKAS